MLRNAPANLFTALNYFAVRRSLSGEAGQIFLPAKGEFKKW
jgi:hypothetical protein